MIYDVPNGVRSGVTVCVGRALGAGLPSLASLAIRNGLLLLGCWLPLPLFAVCAFNSGWARIFTRDESVILQLHALVPWLVVNSCAGGLMAIANAVMAGCARPKSPFLHPGPTRTKVAPSDTLPHRQKTAAKLAQLCFTCIGFPLGLLLGFSFGLGVQGFVAGQAAGLAGLAQGRGGVRQERTMILSRSSAQDGYYTPLRSCPPLPGQIGPLSALLHQSV